MLFSHLLWCLSFCLCEDCNPDVNFHVHDQLLDSVPSLSSCELSAQKGSNTTTVSKSIQKTLKEQLTAYRGNLISEGLTHATALVGIELCTGLTDQTIATIYTFIVRVTFWSVVSHLEYIVVQSLKSLVKLYKSKYQYIPSPNPQ